MRTRAFGAVLILIFRPLGLWACECGPPGPACAYVPRAAAVFIGKVTFTDHNPSLGLRQRTFVKFEIEEVFKGLPSGTTSVWIDPGSFSSCYAEYSLGERLLVFAYGGRLMPPDTAAVSVVAPSESNPKPLPPGFDRNSSPLYGAPECSGTRAIARGDSGIAADLAYLRQHRMGNASPQVRGRITEDASFGIFQAPGLRGVNVMLTGSATKRSVKTDTDGYYLFDNVKAGAYLVTPALKPYVPSEDSREIEVPVAGCGSADFDMTAPGVIEGNLLDKSGHPAANVEVEVLRLSGDGKPIYYAQKETKTDANGKYWFGDLPSGNFAIGINLFNAPVPTMPYAPTRWSGDGRSFVHLTSGEHKKITSFRLPAPSVTRKVEAQVLGSDNRPAQGINVFANVGNRAATFGKSDINGLAKFDVLDGISYRIQVVGFDIRVSMDADGQRTDVQSGVVEVKSGSSDPIHLRVVLGQRTLGPNIGIPSK